MGDKPKIIYVVIERYCLTENDDNYDGRTILRAFKDAGLADEWADMCDKKAEKDSQDYKYEVEEVELY